MKNQTLPRKTVMPFTGVEDMYSKTSIRVAMIPDTSFVDYFKYSPDPTLKKIYDDRIQPHLQEYRDFPDHLSYMIHFIKDDPNTALWDTDIAIL